MRDMFKAPTGENCEHFHPATQLVLCRGPALSVQEADLLQTLGKRVIEGKLTGSHIPHVWKDNSGVTTETRSY